MKCLLFLSPDDNTAVMKALSKLEVAFCSNKIVSQNAIVIMLLHSTVYYVLEQH